MNALSLLGSMLGLGFAAGLNIYATVLVVGLGVRFGFIHQIQKRENFAFPSGANAFDL